MEDKYYKMILETCQKIHSYINGSFPDAYDNDHLMMDDVIWLGKRISLWQQKPSSFDDAVLALMKATVKESLSFYSK